MRTQRRLLALSVVLLVIGSLLPSQIAVGISARPHDLLIAVTAPASWLQLKLTDVRDRPGVGPASLGHTDDDYAQALRQNANLRARLDEANRRIEKLSQIRRLGLTGERLLETRVLGRSGQGGEQVLTIGAGTRDGVVRGQTVVDGVNLVGRVVSVTPSRATVRPGATLPAGLVVRVGPPKPQAERKAAQLLVKPSEDGDRFTTERVSVSLQIQVGDWAQLDDRNWPAQAQGFVVGRVTRVVKDEEDPLQHRIVTVVPSRPLHALRDVTVLVPVHTATGDE